MNETKTYKKLKDKPQNNFPKWLIVHHSGGTDADPLLDTSHHTAQMMEEWHLAKGWEGLGYQYVIHKDGIIWLGRPEYRNGAHTVGYNEQSIGICLAGNFDATLPTDAQVKTLTQLLKDLMLKYKIGIENIVPHRKFANKSCYGLKLKDDWARNLVKSQEPIQNKDEIKKKIRDLLDLL